MGKAEISDIMVSAGGNRRTVWHDAWAGLDMVTSRASMKINGGINVDVMETQQRQTNGCI